MSQLTMDMELLPCEYPHIRNVKRDPDTLYVLNWGVGKNSSALIVLLVKLGVPLDVIIFADTGDEMPETMEWLPSMVEWLNVNAPHIKVITAKSTRAPSLSKHYIRKKIIPIIARRTCTVDFKITPIRQTARKLMTAAGKHKLLQYIGIAVTESHRIKPPDRKFITFCYPLVDLHITRPMCDRIVVGAGLTAPIKSGCFFCPFQPKARWRELYFKHPDLFEYAKQMEINANDTFNRKGGGKVRVPLSKLEDSFKHQTPLELDDNPQSMCGGEGGCMDG